MDVVLNDKEETDNPAHRRSDDLNETIRKYRALVSTSNTGAWEYFPETGFLDCNDVYFSILGLDIKEYRSLDKNDLKVKWLDFLHPDDREASVNRFKDYLANPAGMYESYFRMKHVNGNWTWICSRGGFLKDHEGENNN